MSKETIMADVSNTTTETVKANDKQDQTEESNDLVSKTVLEDYKKDMFKYKQAAKERELELQKLRDQLALKEKQTLEEKEEWKTLYEREKEEKAKTLAELQKKSEFFLDTSKKNAVVQRLGGFKKDSYTRFIETSKIDVRDDGTFDEDSINKEVDRIKQEYPELLKIGNPQGKMPNEAPSNMGRPQDKNLKGMSTQELIELYSKVKK